MSHTRLAQQASYSPVVRPLLSIHAFTIACVLAVVAAAPSVLRADEVHLTNGRVVKGKVLSEGSQVVVELPTGGTVSLPGSQVARIEKGSSPREELARREAELAKAGTAESAGVAEANAYYRLATWCEDERLHDDAKRLLWTTLELDPNHKQAREKLGFRKMGALWLTEDDYQRALGKVRFGKEWVTKARFQELQQKAEVAAEVAGARQLFRTASGRGDVEVRETALESFRRLPERLRGWTLLRGTESLRWRERQFATRELGALADDRHHNVLAHLAVTDSKRSVRDEALKSLQGWKKEDTVLSFIPYLSSGDDRQRINAARAVNVFPDRRAVGPLVHQIRKIWANFGRAHIVAVTQRAYVKDYELVSGGTGLVVQEVADPVIDTVQTGVVLDIDVQRTEAISYAAALQKITGKKFGTNFDKWSQWWEKEKGKQVASASPKATSPAGSQRP